MKNESKMEEQDVETSEIDRQNLHCSVGMVMSGSSIVFQI
jgi:hypothetical protein